MAYEEAVRLYVENERLYRAVVEAGDDAVLVTSTDGIIIDWSLGAERLYGYSAPEAIGRSVETLIHPDRWTEMQSLLKQAVRGVRIRNHELSCLHSDGRPVNTTVSMSPVHNENGRVIGIVNLTRDTSERKSAENRLRKVLEACPSGVCMIDHAGTIVLVNRAIENLFGYSRDELLGQSVDRLVPMPMRADHARHRQRFVESPETRPMGAGRDLFGVRKDGAQIAVEIGLCPLELNGRMAVLASVVDVTDRRRAQAELADYAARLEKSNAELEKFAYVVSHDLKAPLRGIASVAQWIADDFAEIADEQSKENLNLMMERTSRMSSLIEGILQYSRAGKAGGTLATRATHAIVQDVIASISVPASRTVRIEGVLPDVVYDETQLRQLFQNLIDNAIKHLGKPNGTILVAGRDTCEMCEFKVSDDGVGIPERHFHRIFELFQTLKPKDEVKTAGAGLAIVKRIVETNGGSISVASTEGEGTTFTFTIPKRPPAKIALSEANTNETRGSDTCCRR